MVLLNDSSCTDFMLAIQHRAIVLVFPTVKYGISDNLVGRCPYRHSYYSYIHCSRWKRWRKNESPSNKRPVRLGWMRRWGRWSFHLKCPSRLRRSTAGESGPWASHVDQASPPDAESGGRTRWSNPPFPPHDWEAALLHTSSKPVARRMNKAKDYLWTLSTFTSMWRSGGLPCRRWKEECTGAAL